MSQGLVDFLEAVVLFLFLVRLGDVDFVLYSEVRDLFLLAVRASDLHFVPILEYRLGFALRIDVDRLVAVIQFEHEILVTGSGRFLLKVGDLASGLDDLAVKLVGVLQEVGDFCFLGSERDGRERGERKKGDTCFHMSPQ